MKKTTSLFWIFILALSFTNCKNVPSEKNVDNITNPIIEKELVIENLIVPKSELVLNQLEGKWYYRNQPFNGYSEKYHPNGILGEKKGYYKGKRQGIAQRWSENGVLRSEFYYNQNRLTGSYKNWWENGKLSQESNYIDGVKQGVEKLWYPSGQLAKLRRYVDGIESGLQKTWLENGKLYVNYEAKNGRIYGMRRANSCYKLENEVVVKG